MEKYLKNLDYAAVLPLAQQVDYLPGQVISKTLAQNSAFGLTLFAIERARKSAPTGPRATRWSLLWTARAKSLLMTLGICCMPGTALSCPPGIRTRCAPSRHSKCCWLWSFPRKAPRSKRHFRLEGHGPCLL